MYIHGCQNCFPPPELGSKEKPQVANLTEVSIVYIYSQCDLTLFNVNELPSCIFIEIHKL